MEKEIQLLTTAAILMLLSGVIFSFLKQWIYVGLLCAGAFGCLAAVRNFKNRKDK